MIIAKTPFRISFFGGGTDFPDYFLENGGSVISTTIDKYCYVNIRNLPKFFDYSDEIIYSKIERVNDIDDINHPMIKNIIKLMSVSNIRVTYDADLPARSGLGTSSSFAVSLINAFFSLKNIDHSKRDMSDIAIYVEKEMCKEAGGVQDQIAASFGGLNKIDFLKTKPIYKDSLIENKKINVYDYEINKVNISSERKKELEENLMMFFTGINRNSFKIQEKTQDCLNKNIKNLKELNDMVTEAKKILESDTNMNEFGKLLNFAWSLKKGLNDSVSNDYIDEVYKKGITNGAIGGKLLGAGGGGFLLFYVEKDKQENIKKALQDLIEVPFKFENSGTTIIYKNED